MSDSEKVNVLDAVANMLYYDLPKDDGCGFVLEWYIEPNPNQTNQEKENNLYQCRLLARAEDGMVISRIMFKYTPEDFDAAVEFIHSRFKMKRIEKALENGAKKIRISRDF